MLAQRTALFKSSGTAAARIAAKAAAASGRDIIDLTAGEIWSDLAPSVRDGAITAINRNLNRYTDTVGLLKLRQALAGKVSAETAQPWSADEIAVTSGAKQALFNAAMTLLTPGDEVLIPAPYWTTFPAQVVIAGGTPVFIETRKSNYVPRLVDLSAAATSRTKAIVVNTPNNPTGTIYDRDTLAGIAQLAIDRNLWIIFDECYGAFAHDPHTHHSIVSVAPRVRDRTLIVNFILQVVSPGWLADRLSGRSRACHQRGEGTAKPYDLQSQCHCTACATSLPGARRSCLSTAPPAPDHRSARAWAIDPFSAEIGASAGRSGRILLLS